MSGKNYYVVSHTHWDREWYEPFDVFRYNLVKMMDYLLDTIREQPNFKFNLDCQSVIIEDYLEVKQELRDPCQKFNDTMPAFSPLSSERKRPRACADEKKIQLANGDASYRAVAREDTEREIHHRRDRRISRRERGGFPCKLRVCQKG